MCLFLVILPKITTEPPKTKGKFEILSTSLENGRENIEILFTYPIDILILGH